MGLPVAGQRKSGPVTALAAKSVVKFVAYKVAQSPSSKQHSHYHQSPCNDTYYDLATAVTG